ncbi:SpdA protein [Streptomyces sp. F-3]|uniref:DUF2637 domain-containing protein n=1 Tax=Streptomyces sp. F-3 TaxID=1840095 RepID=UPI0007C3D99D|nr:DUF2637 domain-containing protein [Streptomyces sp. F-3]GAT85231.1 SpdA protein [Streptomyces sp. F-3]
MAEERFTRHTVTVVMAVIAVLAFVFSFGNVWALALRLGVPRPIAPMVDLSVVGLLVALRFLALRGVSKAERKAGTRLLHLCGLLTLALNTAEPLLTGRYGRACLDTVAPLLLLGWGHVGPALLAHFHTAAHREDANTATPAPAPLAEPVPTSAPAPETAAPAPEPVPAATPAPPPAAVPTVIEVPGSAPAPAVAKAPATGSRPALPAALLSAARRIADTHHAEHGTPVTAAQLAARMGVALPVATAALAQL